MIPKIIKNDVEYEAALEQLDLLMDAEAGSAESDTLELWATLIELYEQQAHPVELPSVIDAIRFRMDQTGLKQQDLIPYLGSRSKVSEVLSGKRSLSLAMMRKLHDGLGIPAGVLLQEPEANLPAPMAGLDWHLFPLKTMVSRGWLSEVGAGLPVIKERAEEYLSRWAAPLGDHALEPALLRQHLRSGGKSDGYALTAWKICVSLQALEQNLPVYQPGTITLDFIADLVHLSYLDNGPLLAREFLHKHGIHFIVEAHLPHTHLDGAAIKLPNGAPLVALTLRHDRLDNFWFTLCHELAHVALHFDHEDCDAFFDDLDQVEVNSLEGEADKWASEALISSGAWKAADLCNQPTLERVRSFAAAMRIDPVIPAGRVRRETGNYRLFGKFVAGQKVRRFFEG